MNVNLSACRRGLRKRSKIRSKLNNKEWITESSGKQKRRENCLKSNVPLKKRRLDNREVDKYCWICHLPGQGKVCSQCPRVYHIKCIKSRYSFHEKDICPECQQKSVIGDDEGLDFPHNRLKELLMYAIDRVYSKKKQQKEIFDKWPEHDKNNKLYKIVDVDYFSQQLILNSYKKPIEFLSDFRWLHHNSTIIYGDKSKYALGAEKLVKKLQKELSCLEACADCYFFQNSNMIDEATFFSLVCSKRHEVIWAKVKGYSYWPAKCLKVTKNGSAHVAFFGTHEIGCVPEKMWFSLKSQPVSPQQMQYIASITELLEYNKNIQEPSQKEGCSCDVEKVSKEVQTSTDFQGPTNSGNDYDPEISFITSIENFQEVMEMSRKMDESQPNSTDNLTQAEAVSKIASVSMTFCQEDADSLQISDDEDIEELLFIPKKPINDINSVKSDGDDIQELLCVSKNPPFQRQKSGINSITGRKNQELPFPSKNQPSDYHETVSVSKNVSEIPDETTLRRLSSDNSLPNVQSSLNLLSSIPVALSNAVSEQLPSCLNNLPVPDSSDEQSTDTTTSSEMHNCHLPENLEIPNNLKDPESPAVNFDTAALAKLISTQDPQFSKLFQEKSKELMESMMVHVWAKVNAGIKVQDTATATLVEEAKNIKKQSEEDRKKLQALEDKEKELQRCLGTSNIVVEFLKQCVENEVKVTKEQEKMLSEMKIRLANIKIEKAEITEKYHNMEKVLNGTSST